MYYTECLLVHFLKQFELTDSVKLLYAGRRSSRHSSLRQFVCADTDIESSEDGMLLSSFHCMLANHQALLTAPGTCHLRWVELS